MEKTTVYLSEAQKAALTRAAGAEGRSEATLIRAGVDIVTARHRIGEGATPYAAAEPRNEGAESAARRRPRWVPRDVFVREVMGRQADSGLRADLRELAPDSTDEVAIG